MWPQEQGVIPEQAGQLDLENYLRELKRKERRESRRKFKREFEPQRH